MNEAVARACRGSKRQRQEAIEAYEEAVGDLPQIAIPVTHHIHGGLYGREITIPAGAVVTGHLYRFDHFDVMISGDITVSTDNGEAKRLRGYNCFKAFAGKRRIAYAHEDTVWLTFHSTPPKQDGEEIQKFLTARNYEEFLNLQTQLSRLDFKQLVGFSGFSEAEVRAISEESTDLRDMPEGYNNIYIADSAIEGKGVFSRTAVASGATICPARLQGMRTPAGRYTNHSVCPNAQMRLDHGNLVSLVALRDIEAGEELTVDYRQVLSIQGVLCQV